MKLIEKILAEMNLPAASRGEFCGDIARTIEVSRGFISTIENGKTNPTLATIAKLAKALGVSVKDLVN